MEAANPARVRSVASNKDGGTPVLPRLAQISPALRWLSGLRAPGWLHHQNLSQLQGSHSGDCFSHSHGLLFVSFCRMCSPRFRDIRGASSHLLQERGLVGKDRLQVRPAALRARTTIRSPAAPAPQPDGVFSLTFSALLFSLYLQKSAHGANGAWQRGKSPG